MIQHYLNKVIQAGIELETRKRQYDDMTLIKELDGENMELIVKITKLNGRKLKQLATEKLQ